jgi:hypothetical protein
MAYSDKFHDSNIQFETSFRHSHESLVKALAYDYERLNQLPAKAPFNGPHGPSEVEGAHVLDVTADASGVQMLVAGNAAAPASGSSPDPFEEYVVLGGSDYDPLRSNAYGGSAVEVQVTPYSGSNRPLNQVDVPVEDLVADDRLLVSYPTLDLIDSYRRAATGDPSSEGDPFWRFLYLSAITITTLGFGDITPVSNSARLLVGLEAVLGVAFAGLFLNRAAQNLRREKRPEEASGGE